MKKVLLFIMAIVMVMSLTIPCTADEITGRDWSGYNVSTVNPFELVNQSTTRGTSYPTVSHNCDLEGPLSFSGSASYSMLWLNKVVYGCIGYYVYVKNNSSSTLHYTVRGGKFGDKEMTVSPYSDSTTDNNGYTLYFPMNSTQDLFCISFNAPSNFKGSVSCGCMFGG